MAGRKLTWDGAWLALANAYGGVEALAVAIQVSRRALERWALDGAKPNRPTQQLVNQLAKRRRLEPPFPEVDDG